MSATTRPSAPTPTAPGNLPLIGHAHRLARDPLPFLTSLRRYGSAVRIRIGPSPAYVVTDPALTRRVLMPEIMEGTIRQTILPPGSPDCRCPPIALTPPASPACGP
ncbi:hypothetical protein WJ438_36560 [Streptomyces sp. GD-15H]|uniref:hypothetical protein n=1 Tax=Streptomyces sp. GD-15H TaxID=3129112 RepID=UPI003247AF54